MGSSQSTISNLLTSDLEDFYSDIFTGFSSALTLSESGISPTNPIYKIIEDHFKDSVEEHVSNGIVYTPGYRISKIVQIKNKKLWQNYKKGCAAVQSRCDGKLNEKLLFHGTSNTKIITTEGFNSKLGRGMFGRGTYFATHSSKSNQYVFRRHRGGGCSEHDNDLCTECSRRVLVCRVALGNVMVAKSADCSLTAPPDRRYTSVMGRGGYTETGLENNILKFDEYVVYEGQQIYPAFLIEYTMVLNNYRLQDDEDSEESSYSNDEDEDDNTTTDFSLFIHFLLNVLNDDELEDYEDDVETLTSLVKWTCESREHVNDSLCTIL